MKILHLIPSLEIGGTERMLLQYLENCHDPALCHVVCTIYDRGALREELKKIKIEYFSLALQSKFFYPLAFLKFFFLTKKINPDIIHSYLLQDNLINRTVGRIIGKIVINGKRDTDRYKPFYKVWLDRLTLQLAHIHISNSKTGVKELKNYGVHEDKIIYAPNGKDVPRFIISKNEAREKLGLEKNDILAGTVGRLYSFKGQKYAIEAVGLLVKKFPNLKLLLIGDGTERNCLEKIVKEQKIDENVIFMGERHEINDILAALDLFVFPSLREGLPGALMEAMAVGLPCIASDIEGCRELIENRKNGLLVPAENPRAIAEALEYLIQNNSQAKKLGSEAQQTILQQFTITTMVSDLNTIYKRK